MIVMVNTFCKKKNTISEPMRKTHLWRNWISRPQRWAQLPFIHMNQGKTELSPAKSITYSKQHLEAYKLKDGEQVVTVLGE